MHPHFQTLNLTALLLLVMPPLLLMLLYDLASCLLVQALSLLASCWPNRQQLLLHHLPRHLLHPLLHPAALAAAAAAAGLASLLVLSAQALTLQSLLQALVTCS
jgi:hypothetical protein